MNRDEIRNRATSLGIKTAKYKYASNIEELSDAAKKIGFPMYSKASNVFFWKGTDKTK